MVIWTLSRTGRSTAWWIILRGIRGHVPRISTVSGVSAPDNHWRYDTTNQKSFKHAHTLCQVRNQANLNKLGEMPFAGATTREIEIKGKSPGPARWATGRYAAIGANGVEQTDASKDVSCGSVQVIVSAPKESMARLQARGIFVGLARLWQGQCG